MNHKDDRITLPIRLSGTNPLSFPSLGPASIPPPSAIYEE